MKIYKVTTQITVTVACAVSAKNKKAAIEKANALCQQVDELYGGHTN